MAHADWISSSSRKIQPRAMLTKYDTDKGNTLYDVITDSTISTTVYTKWVSDKDGNITYKNPRGTVLGKGLTIRVTADIDAEAIPTDYFQINGNKDTNGYPVDFTLSNKRIIEEGTISSDLFEINIVKNNTYNCIIKSNNGPMPFTFDIIITKWSIPNTIITLYTPTTGTLTPTLETIFPHIGFDVRFDLVSNNMVTSEMCPLIELPYNGTNELQYGIKTSQFNLQLNKDTPNTGYQYEYINANLIPSQTNPVTGTAVNTFGSSFIYITIDSEKLNITKGDIYYIKCNVNITSDNDDNISKNLLYTLGIKGQALKDNYSFDINKNFTISSRFVANSDTEDSCIRLIFYIGLKYTNTTNVYYTINDLFIVNLTSIYGSGNEPSTYKCDKYMDISEDKTYIEYYGERIGNKLFDFSLVTKSKFIVDNVDNEYIDFGIKLDKETSFTRLGNFYVTGSDYNEISNTFNIELKDNTKLLQENIMPLIDTTSISNNASIQELFNLVINKQMSSAIGLDFSDFDIGDKPYSLPSIQYPINQTYFNVYKKLCEAFLINIFQDITNIRGLDLTLVTSSNFYEIHNNQCYSLKLYNNIDNSVSNVSYETLKYKSAGGSFATEAQGDLQYTLLDGYMEAYDYKDNKGKATLYTGYSSIFDPVAYRLLVPKLTSDGNTISGTIAIDSSKYDSNKDYLIKILGAKAEFIDGQTNSGDYVPSSDGKTKKYIHTKNDGTEVLVDSTDSLSDNDYSFVAYSQINNIDAKSSGNNIVFSYSITFDAKAESYNNKYIHNSTPIPLQAYIITCYLGAYKVVLVSQEREKTNTTTQTFTSGNGNLYKSGENEFIQTDSKVGNTEMSIAAYNADKILTGFSRNRAVAELEWIGSPYVNINNIIKLDNGLDYRVYYIEHKIDGGYRQKLKLVQKEDS